MTRARTIADYAKQTTDLATQTELDAAETALGFQSVPHIVPGVLYPAVAGKLLDGSTSHSGNYGTAQSDGRSYYYTDIKGSKPIKDPRIGGHFGSQRHKFKSLQLLEQETATHGDEVYSIDGREWARFVRVDFSNPPTLNDDGGAYFQMQSSSSKTAILEVTGYFNELNIIGWTYGTGAGGNVDSSNPMNYHLNGGSDLGNISFKQTFSGADPKGSRYVDAGSVINVESLNATLGINTIKFVVPVSKYASVYGIELIAQDTSSTANRSKIQIPSQNVVSYGKKFTVSGTPHYDPFNGFTSGTDISSYIDEATSLGMSNWKVSSTWYRPFNGGRVVKWVDSSGNIKTSVTMMPPNAQNIGTTASNAIDLSSSQTNDDTINFNTSAIDHSLSEVAKTFHVREFGNGAANGGTGATWADASMLSGTADDIAYVMDDGLTSLSADDYYVNNAYGLIRNATGKDAFITFIGTGIAMDGHDGSDTGLKTIVQNLPYGTHIFKLEVNDSSTSTGKWYVDGVEVKDWDGTTGNNIYEHGPRADISFHQPKKPPIPEEAVVLCDFMLMADHVVQTAEGLDKLSKGTRVVSGTRDAFYDGGSPAFQLDVTNFMGMSVSASNNASNLSRIPAFGTNAIKRTYIADARYQNFYINDTGHSSAATTTKVGSGHGSFYYPSSSVALGTNIFETFGNTNNSATTYTHAWEIVTPIHTSSHYQPFETPYLHELVGGDRNMEQTNLVVTSDGKTWDEVTRDTSYIGKGVLAARISADYTSETTIIFDDFRGLVELQPLYNKDFAIAYDRFICLKDGAYNVDFMFHASAAATSCYLRFFINGTRATESQIEGAGSLRGNLSQSINYNFKRGDYLQISATNRIEGTDQRFHTFQITRL